MSRPFQDNTVAEQDPVTAYDFCDPLAKAESWFLSASVRLRSLEVKRQKLALEAQEIQEPDGTDDEDTLYDLEFQATQGITPQDVSGIYPTPPDGIRSSLTVSSPTNVQNQVDREAEQSVHPTPQASNRPYAEHESGDLFDEIEMDMFTANGLTEADFSFFDEPSPAYEELQHDGHVIVEDDDFAPRGESPMNVFPQGTRDPSSAPPIAVCQMDSSPVLDPGVSPEVSLALETFGSAVQSQISSESQIVDHDQSPTKIEIQPSEENAVDPGWMNRETQAAQKTSFDTVPFRAKSFEFDDKYALTGRYGFGLDDLANPVDQGGLLPHKTESLPQIGIAYVNGSQSEADAMTDDTVEERQALASGLVEDTVALDVMEESPQITSLKRKRTSKDHSRNSSPHNSPAPTDSESLGHVAQEPCSPALGLFSATTFEDPKQSSMTMLGSEDSHKPRFTGRDKTFIQRIACILAGFATNAGKRSRRCSLKGLASLGSPNIAHGSIEQIGHPPAQKLQRPTFPTRASTAGLQSIFKLHTPYTRVQRTGTSIDVNASALRFWEELSLAPSHGSKDVTAFCIYPVNLDIHSNVKTFLEMVGGAYQSCKMGTFVRGSCPVERSQSLPTVPSDTTSGSQDLLSRMKLACDQFGQSLGDQRLQHGNTAVYFANFYGPQHLPTICAGFLKLFEAYNVTVKQKQVDQPNDLLLQIIPSELIYSSDIIAMPSPSDYRRLALEVYDRCGPNCSNERKRNPQYVSAPAIRLAKAIPKSIDLRLNPDSSGPVLQTDNCLHVAYAWDISDRWLTASWTDNLGILSWNACYCFGEPEEAPWQSFSDVAKEIWETTCDMMRSRNVPWRLFICKDGAAHSKESDTWQALLMNHTKPSIISTFLTVETDPLLRFPFFDAQNNGSELVSYPLATPGATPQPNAPSPDVGSTPTGASAQVSTPPAGNAFGDSYDADARLIDITEETWGMEDLRELASVDTTEIIEVPLLPIDDKEDAGPTSFPKNSGNTEYYNYNDNDNDNDDEDQNYEPRYIRRFQDRIKADNQKATSVATSKAAQNYSKASSESNLNFDFSRDIEDYNNSSQHVDLSASNSTFESNSSRNLKEPNDKGDQSVQRANYNADKNFADGFHHKFNSESGVLSVWSQYGGDAYPVAPKNYDDPGYDSAFYVSDYAASDDAIDTSKGDNCSGAITNPVDNASSVAGKVTERLEYLHQHDRVRDQLIRVSVYQ
ncbi:hypothetical protein P7C71_g1026, partial [Lecanoromycetidae sp. Uapishka_2]